ncbi:hypothetical protein ACFWNK_16495 [Streptomyces sp. NPDC058417]|uniref:hypothetical protein n=1 Tax=unclassified Streptomyces TaxID=2593676 RepID=UPI0036471E32
MAKNKNRERKQPQSARGQQETRPSAAETRTEQHLADVTPGDMARKSREKRFGHN